MWIGFDIWIGVKVSVLCGIIIGWGCVFGLYVVVCGVIFDYLIVVGVLVKVVKNC